MSSTEDPDFEANKLRKAPLEHDGFARASLDAPTIAHAVKPTTERDAIHLSNYSDQAHTSFPWKFGDYEVVEEIARGGMGVVYKARQISLNRMVALKMILTGQLASNDDVKRFYLEAESAAGLSHPGIVPIYEIGQHGGQHFFSMGLVEGTSLAQLLKEGPLAPREAAECLARVCDAIQYAHEHGVVHRDLKPGNILLDTDFKNPEGSSNIRFVASDLSSRTGSFGQQRFGYQPKVTDFGLAKQLHQDSDLTNTGQVLGTPSYMPPEQVDPKIAPVGPLADMYAVGAILYCMLTGRPPFQANNPLDTLMQVVKAQPVPPRQLNASIPRDLETICLKAIEKNPSKRYASVSDLQQELMRFLRGEPILARPIGRLERSYRWLRRNPSLAALGILALLSFVGFTAMNLIANQRLQKERDIAIHATRDANEQRTIAQKRLEIAIEAIDKLMVRVASENWSSRPELQKERQSMLEDAVSFYRGFVSESNNDLRVRSEAAKAQTQLANAYLLLNDLERSIESANTAQSIYTGLITESIKKAEFQIAASEVASIRANAFALSAKYDESTKDYQLAKTLAEHAVQEDHSAQAQVRSLEADSQFAYFLLSFNPNQGKEIVAGIEKRIESLFEIAGQSYAANLAVAFARTVEGAYFLVLSEFNKAFEKYELANQTLERIKTQDAPSARLMQHFRYTQAIVTSQRGFLIAMRGMDRDAKELGIAQMRLGESMFDRLIELNPSAFPFRMQKIQVLRMISTFHRSLGENELASKADRDASTLLEALIKENPKMEWLKALDAARYSIAWVEQTRTGNLDDFEQRAAWFLEKTPARSRGDVRYNVACAYAIASQFDVKNRERFMSIAESILSELFSEGYFNTAAKIQLLKKDEDLKALHERTRFREIVQALQ